MGHFWQFYSGVCETHKCKSRPCQPGVFVGALLCIEWSHPLLTPTHRGIQGRAGSTSPKFLCQFRLQIDSAAVKKKHGSYQLFKRNVLKKQIYSRLIDLCCHFSWMLVLMMSKHWPCNWENWLPRDLVKKFAASDKVQCWAKKETSFHIIAPKIFERQTLFKVWVLRAPAF